METNTTNRIEEDPMLQAAINLVLEQGQASTALLQMRLSIGYARAARVLDRLEELGYVGPYEGPRPRRVFRPGEADESSQ